MGEAGSQGASSGACPAAPSCETESVLGLLSLPQELVSTILDFLPRRSLPNVRLVCRKLETACQGISRLCIRLEAQPIQAETHHLFHLEGISGLEARKAAASSRRPAQLSHEPSASIAGSLQGLPSWCGHLCDLHLPLRTEPPQDPQPIFQGVSLSGNNGLEAVLVPDAQLQVEWNIGLVPDLNLNAHHPLEPPANGQGAEPQEQAAPDGGQLQGNQGLQIHVQLPGQEIQVQAALQGANVLQGFNGNLQPGPAQPQAPGAAAWAQLLADHLQVLLQQAGNDPANLAAGQQALVANVEAVLAVAAAGIMAAGGGAAAGPPNPPQQQQPPNHAQQELQPLPQQQQQQQEQEAQQEAPPEQGAPPLPVPLQQPGGQPGAVQGQGNGQGHPAAVLAVQDAAAAAAAGPGVGGPFHGPAAALVGLFLAAAGHQQQQQLQQPEQEQEQQDAAATEARTQLMNGAAAGRAGAAGQQPGASAVAAGAGRSGPDAAAAMGGSADDLMVVQYGDGDGGLQRLGPLETAGGAQAAAGYAPASSAGTAAAAGGSGRAADAELELQDADATALGGGSASTPDPSTPDPSTEDAAPPSDHHDSQGAEAEAAGPVATGDGVAGVAAGGIMHRPALTPARAEAVLNAKMEALAVNLMPHLHRLRLLSLEHVPRGCMAVAGELAAAATSLTELRMARAEPAEPPPVSLGAPVVGGGVAGVGEGVAAAPPGLLQAALQHMNNLVNLHHPLHFGLHHHHHGFHHQLLHQHLLAGMHNEFDNVNADADLAMDDVAPDDLDPPHGGDGDDGAGNPGGGDGNGDVEASIGDAGALAAGAETEAWMEDATARVATPAEQSAGDVDIDGGSLAHPPLAGDALNLVDGFWARQEREQDGTAAREVTAAGSSGADRPQGSGEERLELGPGPGWAEGPTQQGLGNSGRGVAGGAPVPSTQAGPSTSGSFSMTDLGVQKAAGEAGLSSGGGVGGNGVRQYDTDVGGYPAMRSRSSGCCDEAQAAGAAGPGPSRGQGMAGGGRPNASGGGAADSFDALSLAASLAVDPDGADDDPMATARDAAAGGGHGGGGGGGGGSSGGGSGSESDDREGGGEGEGEDGCDAAFWSRVATLPHLRTLVLRGGRLRAADMAGLVALTGLQQLVVNHVVNMHPGLACLASLTGLTRLVIEDLQYLGGAIHDEFCGLSRLTGLRSLSFLVVGPLPAEVMAWGALSQLTQLEITNHYDENLLPCFACVLPRLPHLSVLNLSNFDINNAIMAALRPCTQLSSLQMGRFNLMGPCQDCMPSVKVLQLNFVDDLQHTEVPLVSVFPSLDELSLQTRYVLSDESAKRIPRELLSPPKHLATTRLHLYDALMSPLLPASLPALRSLRLDWNQTPTRELVSYMGQWGSELTALVWTNCDAIGDDGLAALAASLPKLTEMELGRCVAVTDGGLLALTALTCLTSLAVSGAPQLTLAGFSPLVPRLRRLVRLTLRDMAPGISAAEATQLEDLGWRPGGIQVDYQQAQT